MVTPGFIDMLGQSEITMLVDPHVPSKIFQGITTEITGEGDSIAPQTDATLARMQPECQHYGITCDWHTLTEYFARLQKQGMGINLGTYVGATQAREIVIGNDDVKATPEQLEKMKELVAEAMREGAMGVSSALEYPPAPYASTEELIALASVSAQYGGIYATHMRNEGDGEMDALEETARIAREAHIPVEIFHLKTAGRPNWGKMPEVVAFIDKARRRWFGHRGGHLRVYGLGERNGSVHSAVGARRRQRKADCAIEGSGDARTHSQRYGDAD